MSRTEVTVHGLVHEVEIHDLSPSSMYVVGLPVLEVGTKVAVAIISSEQSRVSTLGQVKYALTASVAARFRVHGESTAGSHDRCSVTAPGPTLARS